MCSSLRSRRDDFTSNLTHRQKNLARSNEKRTQNVMREASSAFYSSTYRFQKGKKEKKKISVRIGEVSKRMQIYKKKMREIYRVQSERITVIIIFRY